MNDATSLLEIYEIVSVRSSLKPIQLHDAYRLWWTSRKDDLGLVNIFTINLSYL